MEQNLKLLYAGADSREKLQNYYQEKLLLLFKVFLTGVCMLGLLALSLWGNPLLTEGYYLPRKGAAYVAELVLSAEGEKTRNLQVRVEPRKLNPLESKRAAAAGEGADGGIYFGRERLHGGSAF